MWNMLQWCSHLQELHADQLKTLALEAADDFSDQPALNSVWLHSDERALVCAGPSCSQCLRLNSVLLTLKAIAGFCTEEHYYNEIKKLIWLVVTSYYVWYSNLLHSSFWLVGHGIYIYYWWSLFLHLCRCFELISWLACHHIIICWEWICGFLLNVTQNHHN